MLHQQGFQALPDKSDRISYFSYAAVDYVTYQLENGFVANWLVAGPLAIPLEADSLPAWAQEADISGTPVERGPLESGVFLAAGHSGAWMYQACLADHFVDHSGAYQTHHHLRSWA